MKVKGEVKSSVACAARFFAGSIVLAVVVLTASPAQATLLTYEGFGYNNNTILDSTTGGSGWAADWGQFLGNNTAYTNKTGSLADPTATLTTTGNHVESGAGGFEGRYNNFPSYGANGTTAFFSILLRVDSLGLTGQAGGGNGGFILQLFTSTANGDLAIGKNGTDSTWDLEHGSTRVSAGSSPVVGQTVLLVLRADYLNPGVDTFKLYINPTGQTEPGSPNATMSYDIGTQNGLGLNVFNGAKASFDEIRIGTTWADVVPGLVPEPTTFALVGLGMLGALVIRRRK